jgi:co-chaperonin GroES (HSP10)
MMTVKPKGFRVLVEMVGRRKVGGLEIPRGGDDHNRIPLVDVFKVIEIGDPLMLASGQTYPIPVKVGDEIVMTNAPYKLHPLLFGGRELYIVDAGDIYGTAEGEPEPLKPGIIIPSRDFDSRVVKAAATVRN